jgi:prevent-host-death family protein
MKTMAAGEFKAKCLAVMDEVAAKREAVVLTKRGKAVAKLVPMEHETEKDPIFGFLKDKAWIIGDPDEWVKPIVPEEDWSNTLEPAE